MSQSENCSSLLEQSRMEMVKIASTPMVERIEELLLEPVSGKESTRKGDGLPKGL